MKIAVCYSGICRGKVERNINLVKHHFPKADLFFSTWEGKEEDITKNLPKEYVERVHYHKEPKPDYHCVRDVDGIKANKFNIIRDKIKKGQYDEAYIERTLHHTKQILAHYFLMMTVPDDYDMIIRIRYDTLLSKQVDFQSYLNKAYDEKFAIGFGVRKSRHKTLDKFLEIPRTYPRDFKESQDWAYYLMDPMIFHHRSIWNNERVMMLYNNHMLAAAEYGWYQCLSEPYGDNHLCVYGGAQIEKYL